MLPLSKSLDPTDFDQLGPELAIVDASFTAAREQHPMRRWEYAMALRAYDQWAQLDYERYGHVNHTHGGRMVDVGGAGSPFRYMFEAVGAHLRVIDPEENATLAQHIRYAGLQSCVFCLSVLEHIPDADFEQFLYHLSCLVAPGGLLFLTMDYWDTSTVDTAHFHWMRQRIFTLGSWLYLGQAFKRFQFDSFGEHDLHYHGAQVYDYTFASLALIKRA